MHEFFVQPSSIGDAVQGNANSRQSGPATATAAAASWQTLWGATPSWATNTGQPRSPPPSSARPPFLPPLPPPSPLPPSSSLPSNNSKGCFSKQRLTPRLLQYKPAKAMNELRAAKQLSPPPSEVLRLYLVTTCKQTVPSQQPR